MFCNFFPIILPWDRNIGIKNNTNYSTIYLEVQNCGLILPSPHHHLTIVRGTRSNNHCLSWNK